MCSTVRPVLKQDQLSGSHLCACTHREKSHALRNVPTTEGLTPEEAPSIFILVRPLADASPPPFAKGGISIERATLFGRIGAASHPEGESICRPASTGDRGVDRTPQKPHIVHTIHLIGWKGPSVPLRHQWKPRVNFQSNHEVTRGDHPLTRCILYPVP
jgi:hypothetical protein